MPEFGGSTIYSLDPTLSTKNNFVYDIGQYPYVLTSVESPEIIREGSRAPQSLNPTLIHFNYESCCNIHVNPRSPFNCEECSNISI